MGAKIAVLCFHLSADAFACALWAALGFLVDLSHVFVDYVASSR